MKQATGGTWVPIGEEISEKLDYTPSSLFVRRIVRPKYVVRFPDTDRPDELQIAELPSEALPKSKAAPGLVADVIVSKLVDHLPLYRQEQRYARQGFSIARSTLCGWLAEAADVLSPLWQMLKERVLAADIVNTDEGVGLVRQGGGPELTRIHPPVPDGQIGTEFERALAKLKAIGPAIERKG